MEGGTGGERGRGWGGEEQRVNVDDEVSYGGTTRSLFHGTRQGQMSGIAPPPPPPSSRKRCALLLLSNPATSQGSTT